MPRKPKLIGRDASGRPVYRFRQSTRKEMPAVCKACKREPPYLSGFCYWCADRMGIR